MPILHKDIRPTAGDPNAGTHVLHYYTFNDVTAMNAGTDALLGPVVFAASDIGKVARVGAVAPYSFYVLSNNTGPVWTPLGGGFSGYNGPLVAEQTGVVESHVGSIYLTSGSTVSVDTTALMGTQAGGTASFRVRRFTGGAIVLTLTSSSTGLSVASLGAPVAIAADDYYDFFLFGDAAPTVSIIRSLYLVVD